MLRVRSSAYALSPDYIATWLVRRAQQVGVDQAINDLRIFTESSTIPCISFLALAGLRPDTAVYFSDGFQVEPTSPEKFSHRPKFPFHDPMAAVSCLLSQTEKIPKLIVESNSPSHDDESPFELYHELTELKYCLGLAGSWASHTVTRGFEVPESVPSPGRLRQEEILGGEGVWHFHRVQLSEDQCREAYSLFTCLKNSPNRAKFQIPLARLESSVVTKPTLPDALIDLRIALESLLLGEKDQGELRYRIGLRAARVSKANLQTRADIAREARKLYDTCSSAVHTGKVKGGLPTARVARDGQALVRSLLRSMIQMPEIDWDKIEYS